MLLKSPTFVGLFCVLCSLLYQILGANGWLEPLFDNSLQRHKEGIF